MVEEEHQVEEEEAEVVGVEDAEEEEVSQSLSCIKCTTVFINVLYCINTVYMYMYIVCRK